MLIVTETARQKGTSQFVWKKVNKPSLIHLHGHWFKAILF